MKFAAAALLVASASAADFQCVNTTVQTFVDKDCATNDTNETKKTEGAAKSKAMTDGFKNWVNCTMDGADYKKATCNATHYSVTTYSEGTCATVKKVTVDGK